jgi:hypothetical protein
MNGRGLAPLAFSRKAKRAQTKMAPSFIQKMKNNFILFKKKHGSDLQFIFLHEG